MSAHVLLNLLNKLRKKEMECEACNKFNQFNKIGALMLDSIYHRTLNYLKITFLE